MEGRCGRRQPVTGFALVEILLALAILILAGALVVRLANQYQRRRACDRLAMELREYAEVFRAHGGNVATNAGGGEAVLPDDLQARLKGTNWFNGSPVGGRYEWRSVAANPGGRGLARGTIALTAFAPSFPLKATLKDWHYVDAALDDGNLATGRFRTGFNGWPLYFVDAPP